MLPRLFGCQRRHLHLRALLQHRSALAPLGVFASLWVANPRKGRLRPLTPKKLPLAKNAKALVY